MLQSLGPSREPYGPHASQSRLVFVRGGDWRERPLMSEMSTGELHVIRTPESIAALWILKYILKYLLPTYLSIP